MRLDVEAEVYLAKRQAAGMDGGTIRRCRSSFKHFAVFLKEKNIADLRDVDEKTACEYVAYIRRIKHYKTKQILGCSSQSALLTAVRQLYKHLYLEEKILKNPFEEVKMGKRKDKIPRDILSEQELDLLFEALKNRYGLFGFCCGRDPLRYGHQGRRTAESEDPGCEPEKQNLVYP